MLVGSAIGLAFLSASRLDGLPAEYLVRWITFVGFGIWVFAGWVTLDWLAQVNFVRARRGVAAGIGVGIVAILAGMLSVNSARANPPDPVASNRIRTLTPSVLPRGEGAERTARPDRRGQRLALDRRRRRHRADNSRSTACV